MCFSMFCIFKRHVYFAYSNFPIVSIRERRIVEKMAKEEKEWKKTVARDWTVFLGLCSQSTIERDTNLANCLSSPSSFALSPSLLRRNYPLRRIDPPFLIRLFFEKSCSTRREYNLVQSIRIGRDAVSKSCQESYTYSYRLELNVGTWKNFHPQE